jgi:hypothetical protein
MTTWKELFDEIFEETGDTFENTIITLTPEEMVKKFNCGYGSAEGVPFTGWSEKYVYFPCVYDGAEWIGYVSRNPDGKPTNHIGGQ